MPSKKDELIQLIGNKFASEEDGKQARGEAHSEPFECPIAISFVAYAGFILTRISLQVELD